MFLYNIMFYFEYMKKKLKRYLFKLYLQKLYLNRYIYGITTRIRDCTKI